MPKKSMRRKKLQLNAGSTVALVYRPETDKAVSCAIKVAEFLKERDIKVYTAPHQALIPGTRPAKTKQHMDDIELVIVLGGDGTYLRAVRLLEGRSVPLLGFNMGSLGFLTAHHADSVFDILEKTIKGKMALCPRSMICARILRKGKVRSEFHALNDIVIERGSMSQLINTALFSEGLMVSQVKADGFIVASPSGSTAYNLAAGGPIVDPDSSVFVITPVAPHSLTSRPLIFPDKKELSFKLEGKTQKAHFIVDGQKETEITAEDEVIIARSWYDHWMLREPGHNYFHLLREKLKFGDRS